MISRRNFLGAATAAAATGFLLQPQNSVQAQAQAAARTFPSEIYKALIAGAPTDENCAAWKAAGFDGMEVTSWDIPVEQARANRLIAEKHGISVHSIMRGWTNVNQPNNYDADVESVKRALRVAAAYGADGVLLVPCRIGGGNMRMPEPWDFDIDFDPKTLMIKTVAEGNNAPYADYIAAHNVATEASIRLVEDLIPTAAREGVRICLENVWNNLWSTPKFFAAFCKYFDHPWVGCYFDLGNQVKYAKCEEWIKELGNSLIKLHIKGYKVTEVKGKLGGGVGDWCPIDEASIDWKSVRKLLAENRYSGWLTIEEGRRSTEQYSRILDEIIAM
ncbi:MAG: sugar phosphate isomerase/epimerase [Planctomycetaceae bacterium]|nr:sugar phosphate isomerase/epimerase [Planctomycetaceae bacterium]